MAESETRGQDTWRKPATTCSTATTAPTTPGTGRIRLSTCPNNCNLAEVEHIKNFTATSPSSAPASMEPVKVAAAEIEAGRLDAVAIARQNLVDPEWIHQDPGGPRGGYQALHPLPQRLLQHGQVQGYERTCRPLWDSMHLARCALTPPTMQHNKYKIVPTTKPKKVAIIGGGIGGMECALVLKQPRPQAGHLREDRRAWAACSSPPPPCPSRRTTSSSLSGTRRRSPRNGIEVRFNTEINDIKHPARL